MEKTIIVCNKHQNKPAVERYLIQPLIGRKRGRPTKKDKPLDVCDKCNKIILCIQNGRPARKEKEEPEQKSHKCPKCERTFDTLHGRFVHQARAHKKETA